MICTRNARLNGTSSASRHSIRRKQLAMLTLIALTGVALNLTPVGYSIAQADVVDLADIVGGGDGTGTGADQGISMLTGLATTVHQNAFAVSVNSFFASTDNAFVDGVFTPDGGGGATNIQVSSTGLTVSGVSDSTTSETWDHIWNGLNTGMTYSGSASSILGVHANKGITFDLDAIEAANVGMTVGSYDLTAANGDHIGSSMDYYVFVDGVLDNTISLDGSGNLHDFGTVALDENARFLTLIVSSRGDYTGDWGNWVNPTLTLTPIPEPSSILLIGLGALACVCRRRRR